MGAAGDMLMAALLELHSNPDEFLKRLNGIGIPGVSVSSAPAVKHGITGTHVKVLVNGVEESLDTHGHSHGRGHSHDHDHHHSHENGGHTHHSHGHEYPHEHGEHTHHSHNHDCSHEDGHSHDDGHSHSHEHNSYHHIEHLIGHLDVSIEVKKNAVEIYKLIAEAESHAHGVPVNQIHFHEVGEMDAVADIVGVCMLIEELAPDVILASPVHVGSGQVRCAHGILPVPAPATAHILRDSPTYGGNIKGELCTPTGAAILKHYANEFGAMPIMKVSKIGYGMGKKDFEHANCVRAFIGDAARNNEEVVELICNLDDMTPEAVAFAQQILFDEGALDVYTMPIGMKKGRTGILFTCMCKHDLRDKMISLLFKHTTTLGIRENVSRRYILNRKSEEVQTQHGTVRIKTAHGYGVTKAKPEYEDIAKIASENALSLADVIKEIRFCDC